MKKNLTLLTGIVFLITFIIANGCQNKKQNGTAPEEITSTVAAKDSTHVNIFLKEESIDGSMNLLMYDTRKPDCEVLNNLITDVHPGDTVYWRKAKQSRIKSVEFIRPVKDDGTIFPKEALIIRVPAYYEYIIPDSAKPGAEKYEIGFTVQGYEDTIFCIDPYLKIPRTE